MDALKPGEPLPNCDNDKPTCTFIQKSNLFSWFYANDGQIMCLPNFWPLARVNYCPFCGVEVRDVNIEIPQQ